MEPNELKAAKIAATAGLLGAVIGAAVSFSGTLTQSWLQTKLELGKARAEVAIQDRRDFLSKSEKLFGALSDLLSFFDSNHSFEVKQAKLVIAQARKAAFEFAVFTSPEMAERAIHAIEAVNEGTEASNPEQLKSALGAITLVMRDLVASFYKQRDFLDQTRKSALE